MSQSDSEHNLSPAHRHCQCEASPTRVKGQFADKYASVQLPPQMACFYAIPEHLILHAESAEGTKKAQLLLF